MTRVLRPDNSIVADLKFAWRLLLRERAVSAAIVLCLGIGIGATTTVFGVANAMMLRALPFPNGDRVVVIATRQVGVRGDGPTSLPEFSDWRQRTRSFARMGAYNPGLVTLLGDNPERVSSALVRGQFFETLGILPASGRLLLESDMSDAAPRVIVLREGVAVSLFGSAAAAIGQSARLEDANYEVVGVIREAERFPETADVWLPIRRPLREGRSFRFLRVVALLRPGVSEANAQRDMDRIARDLATEYPENASVAVSVATLRERYSGGARPAFILIAFAALMVFAVACANVASLQLSRASARTREVAVRSALGATRARLIRQLLVESFVLASIGGVCGVALAALGSRLVAGATAANVPPWMSFSTDLRTLVFTICISVAATVLCGLVPALRLVRSSQRGLETLRTGGRGGLDRSSGRLQRGLIAAQVAVSATLLVGAALAAKSVLTLLKADLGYRVESALTFRVGGREAELATNDGRMAFVSRILEELDREPGVLAAAATTHLPLRDCCARFRVVVEGRAPSEGDPMLIGSQVTSNYFSVLGAPVLRGREFGNQDVPRSPRVAIVNESFASRYWPGADPITRRLQVDGEWWTVVGVVANVKQSSLADPVEPQFYRPFTQLPLRSVTVVVRFSRDPNGSPLALGASVRNVRSAVRRAAPLSPPTGERWMTELVESSIAAQRLYGILFLSFALSAGFLAIVGLHSMVAYQVARRRTEIGIRSALGAAPAHVRSLIMRQGVGVLVTGFAVGALGSIAIGRVLSSTLSGVRLDDPVPYAGVALVLIAAAALALYLPTRAAIRIDPVEALRSD